MTDDAILIRDLDPLADLAAVEQAYARAADYWTLADRAPPDAAKAASFFTDAPPGCDPARSHHLGLFVDGQLSGLAELSFGFPESSDAYLGLMILSPDMREHGYGWKNWRATLVPKTFFLPFWRKIRAGWRSGSARGSGRPAFQDMIPRRATP
jgi:hypothetical protein